MLLEESFELPFSRAAVWQAFQNVQMMVDCLPGASLTSPVGQLPLTLSFQIKMGPIVAAFAGEGAMAYESADFAGTFSGHGTDRKSSSRVKGQARFALLETAGPVTTVKVRVEFTLTGPLAQFGRIGIVKEIASGITAQFATNLQKQLVPTLPGLAIAPAPTPAKDAAASLNVASLVWQLIKLRVLGFLGRG